MVGLLELRGRFYPQQEVTGAAEAVLPVGEGQSRQADDVTIAASSTDGVNGDDTGNPRGADNPGTDIKVVSEDASELEQRLGMRLDNTLLRLGCSDVTRSKITATLRMIPKAETTHGFIGHVLEGFAIVDAADRPERIRLAGSGKGPEGGIAAEDMAMRGFEQQIVETDIYSANCKGT